MKGYVDASPSKVFFVEMITKDVTVESSILDLIDNCIDSFKKKSLSKGVIHINYDINDDYFEIIDTCGGMSKELAENRAFRFGNKSERSNKSIGMYGIGMKRSLFKIGGEFSVKSKCKDDSFKISVDVKEWLVLKDDQNQDLWKFEYEDENHDFEDGVHIKINKLSTQIRSYFSWQSNIENLTNKIARAYKLSLEAGQIRIIINNEPVQLLIENLFESRILNTYVRTFKETNYEYKIIAGIGEASPKEAGWNIICNGRYIIDREKTELTGWECDYNQEEDETIDNVLKSKRVPAYHNDFARFRGYIILNASDPNTLPLNTTKDGIDEQHPIYIKTKIEMINIMKVVLPSLRDLQKVIRTEKNEFRISPVASFQHKSLGVLKDSEDSIFKLTLSEYKSSDTVKRIPMDIPLKNLNSIKDFLGVQTNKEVGIEIFKFFDERVEYDE